MASEKNLQLRATEAPVAAVCHSSVKG